MKFFKILLLSFSVFLFSSSSILALEETYEAEVLSIPQEQTTNMDGFKQISQTLELKILNKDLKDRVITVNSEGNLAAAPKYKVNDQLVIAYTKDEDGQENFYIQDYVRRSGLYLLFILFVILVTLVGRFWGLSSLVGMAFSFLVIFNFILPQIIAGSNPVIIAILGACAIIPATFYLSHGLNTKTIIAILGTLITLVITGILASIFVELTHLTGFAAEEAGFLQFELAGRLNMKGLLLAGIIISSLGILDDITISQASIVKELKSANKKLTVKELFTRGMNVGRDHIASLVNTLVLVYAGASLPLLLLFVNNPRPYLEILNYEIIADEIVRTLVGSISLVLAVPITTLLAALHFAKKKKD